MSGHEAGGNERAADALRQAFDRSFTLALDTDVDTAGVENLLAVRVGSRPYALRLAEVSGLLVDKKVTWLPSPVAELLGIVGLRNMLLPIYDLGMLLGCPRAVAPRWILVAAARPVGLAFEGFDGYLSARSGAIVADTRPQGIERPVREILNAEAGRPLIHLPSVLDTIRNRGRHDTQI
jgi:chemotaxis signal transduction protein